MNTSPNDMQKETTTGNPRSEIQTFARVPAVLEMRLGEEALPSATCAANPPQLQPSDAERQRAIGYLEATGMREEQMMEKNIEEAINYLRGLDGAKTL